MTAPRAIRVLLADDHPGVLAAVAELLHSAGGFTVVAACHDGAEAVAAAAATDPDVAVLDLAMPGTDGLTATRLLRRDHPGLPVLVLTASTEGTAVQAARDAGAAGLVVKGTDPAALPDQLRQVLAGQQVWPAPRSGSPSVAV